MSEPHSTSPQIAAQGQPLSIEVNKVLRNTYMLLAMTFAFSAVTAFVSMSMNMSYSPFIMLGGFFAILYATSKLQNSPWGILAVFALTGWLGFFTGPVISMYLGAVGVEPILLALGGTAAIFFCCSAYVLITRKELSGMGGFLMVGLLVAFIAAIANIFLQIQGLALAVSSMFLLLSSGMLMYQTSAIIHGGERNYINATVTMFVSIYNIFMSLLALIGFASDD